MANTITINAVAMLQREGQVKFQPLLNATGIRITQSGDAVGGSYMTATTSAANIDVSGVTTPTLGFFENLDATNWVALGWDDTGFVEALRIQPGAVGIVPLSPTRTWQAKSNSASVVLYYQITDA